MHADNWGPPEKWACERARQWKRWMQHWTACTCPELGCQKRKTLSHGCMGWKSKKEPKCEKTSFFSLWLWGEAEWSVCFTLNGNGAMGGLSAAAKSILSNRVVCSRGRHSGFHSHSELTGSCRQQHVSLHLPCCTSIARSQWCVLWVTSGGQLCLKGHGEETSLIHIF